MLLYFEATFHGIFSCKNYFVRLKNISKNFFFILFVTKIYTTLVLHKDEVLFLIIKKGIF